MRAGTWVTGAVLVLGALAGCGGEEGKTSTDAAGTPAATAARTDGPGDYRAPTDLCPKVDFGPLTAAVAPADGSPKGQRTGSDPATGSGAACLQGFGAAGAKTEGRSVVYCTAWKNVATAIKQYKYVLSTARNEARGQVAQIADLGDGAFRYESLKEAAVFRDDLRLLVRASNMECEVQMQSLSSLTAQQVTAAWPAMEETARALLPRLRS
ncbi:hypothetical protein ABZ464_44655 [Streptomyces sp. NPDC005820]|uniref:hypothetical protein n=1 Tax=Streptomyces sp. NPDC005820 TaxID=3157069 RepID=UPI0033ED8B21